MFIHSACGLRTEYIQIGGQFPSLFRASPKQTKYGGTSILFLEPRTYRTAPHIYLSFTQPGCQGPGGFDNWLQSRWNRWCSCPRILPQGCVCFATMRDLSKIQNLEARALTLYHLIWLLKIQFKVHVHKTLSFPPISLSRYRTAGMGGFHCHPCSERCWVTDNKGLGYLTPLLDANLTLVRKLFDTKFWSVLAMIKAFSPLIIAAKVKSSTLGQLRVSWRKPIGVYFTAVVVFMMIESF